MRDFAAGRGRDEACAAWLEGLESIGADAPEITIYRHRWRLSVREGDRAARPEPRPAWRCDGRGAHELGA